MDYYLVFAVAALILAVLGFWIGKTIARLKAEKLLENSKNSITSLELQLNNTKENAASQRSNFQEQIREKEQKFDEQLAAIKMEREAIRKEKEAYKNRLTETSVEFKNLQQKNKEQKTEVEKLQKKFSTEFENLANKILEQKSEKFTLQNKQNIENILNPLQEKIKLFENKVDKNSNESIKRHAQLDKQLEELNKQNIKVSEEAINLTKALKGDTKMQGNWGEMILESVLERSGLQKDSEYFVQKSFYTQENKRVMPDVIIRLPEGKRMIIDAKVSLNAYERYTNETDEKDKKIHLKNHLTAIKKRVEELSKKNYHELYAMESPDFVLLFIPIEAAFAVASNNYPQLYADAFEKNIILVTPTTLLAVLKTIDSIWQNEKQKQNALEIATQAGALYDSFTNLTNELLKVGRQIKTVQTTYDGAMKKLTGRGNLIRRVEKLKKLGAAANKQMDEKAIEKSVFESEKN